MAKSIEKQRAKDLRASGVSVRDIAKRLNVSRGSVSIWVRDIALSPEQKASLNISKMKGSYIGRLKGAETQRSKRIELTERLRAEGFSEIAPLTENEFFLAGIALYWGEGHKTGHNLGWSNSDPRLILFMIDWSQRFCGTKREDFICTVGINESHVDRVSVVEQYWSEITGIPLNQFTKTSLKKVKSKKIYANHDLHFGTLRVRSRKSARDLRKMLGWIEGLSKAA